MNFANPQILPLLLIVPALAVYFLFAFRKRKKLLLAFAENALLEKISSANPARQKIKATLLVLALFFMTVSLARPQFGSKLVEVKQKASDIVIAVDV